MQDIETSLQMVIDATIQEARDAVSPDAALGLDIARVLIADGQVLALASRALTQYLHQQYKRGGFIPQRTRYS